MKTIELTHEEANALLDAFAIYTKLSNLIPSLSQKPQLIDDVNIKLFSCLPPYEEKGEK